MIPPFLVVDDSPSLLFDTGGYGLWLLVVAMVELELVDEITG